MVPATPATPTSEKIPGDSLNDCFYYPLGYTSQFEEWNKRGIKFNEMCIQFSTGYEVPSSYAPLRNFHTFSNESWKEGDSPYKCDQRFLSLSAWCHTSHNFSLGVDVYYTPELPAGIHSIGGVWLNRNDGGHKEWQIRELGKTCIFEYKDNSVSKSLNLGNLADGWNRFIVRWDAASKLWLLTLNGNTVAAEMSTLL
jgi:hypothetical protein